MKIPLKETFKDFDGSNIEIKTGVESAQDFLFSLRNKLEQNLNFTGEELVKVVNLSLEKDVKKITIKDVIETALKQAQTTNQVELLNAFELYTQLRKNPEHLEIDENLKTYVLDIISKSSISNMIKMLAFTKIKKEMFDEKTTVEHYETKEAN